jgi:MFS transporter, CP family, cyanate transporter
VTDQAPAATRAGLDPALIVILAGVCAALHVGKLPPAIPALQQTLGMSLVQAGFLLSLVQLAGMTAGIALGLAADSLGPKRSMLGGLLVLAGASAVGGFARDVPSLLLLRACEGFGFLLVVLPAPGLVRRLVAPGHVASMLGVWGAYMPLGTASALLAGSILVDAAGWPAWWWLLAGVSLAMALWLWGAVPAPHAAAAPADAVRWPARLRLTLRMPGPWLVALTFALYSGQWLAVIGFLPVVYVQAGLTGAATGALTALAAAVNIVGNVASGRLLQRGVPPPALLTLGFIVMGVGAAAAFAGTPDAGLPPTLRYVAVLAFSMVGGVIPATLFSLAVRLAPSEGTLATTVGWVQQWSALGQFAGPPVVAWVASRAGGWHGTWLVAGACSLMGLLLVARIARLLQR